MKFGYVNIFVSHLEQAVDFYTRVFQFDLIDSEPEFGYARLRSAKIAVALAETNDASLYGKHTGIGFIVPDLAEAHKALLSRGATFSMPPTDQPWGGRLALVQDQDHNVFYLDQGKGHS